MEAKVDSTRTHNTEFGNHSGPRGPRPQRFRRENEDKANNWRPVTNLGRLVKAGCIKSIEEIFLHSFAIKEVQIVDHFFAKSSRNSFAETKSQNAVELHDEVMGISPVQKQSSSGQRTRFRVLVIVGDNNGHIGFGAKCDKEVATAIRGAIITAKLKILPVRRGYWGSIIGKPHTVPMKVTGKCASVICRLIPAPKGTGIVGSPVAKKVLSYAGVHDCFTATSGHTRTTGNFIRAIIQALSKTYAILTPNLWEYQATIANPLDTYAKILENVAKKETNA